MLRPFCITLVFQEIYRFPVASKNQRELQECCFSKIVETKIEQHLKQKHNPPKKKTHTHTHPLTPTKNKKQSTLILKSICLRTTLEKKLYVFLNHKTLILQHMLVNKDDPPGIKKTSLKTNLILKNKTTTRKRTTCSQARDHYSQAYV